MFCLVHQVNGNHRAPLPFVIHPASSPKAITLFFQLSAHRKGLPLLPVFFDFFLAFNNGSNGLLLISKRWAQLKIFPTCTAKEDLIKKTMLYSNSKLTQHLQYTAFLTHTLWMFENIIFWFHKNTKIMICQQNLFLFVCLFFCSGCLVFFCFLFFTLVTSEKKQNQGS